MTPEQRFCAYLSGFSELQPNPPDASQWKVIQERLHEALGKVNPAHLPHMPHHTPDTLVAGVTATPSVHEIPAPPIAF
jgi:hypothetical protein